MCFSVECRRANAQGKGLPGGVATRLLGKMDVKVARHVLGKDGKSESDIDNVESAARSFVNDLNIELAKIEEEEVANPWGAAPQPADERREDDRPSDPTFVQYDKLGRREGVLLQQLVDLGFVVGSRVVNKGDTTNVVHITGMSDSGGVSGLNVAEDDTLTRTSVTIDKDSLGQWRLARQPPKTVDLSATSPSSDDAYASIILKSHVAIAIAAKSLELGKPSIVAQTAPSKTVFADADYADGQLTIAFESRKIAVLKKGADLPKKALSVGLPSKFGDRVSYIVGTNSESFFSPGWHVRAGDGVQKCNMALQRAAVVSKIGKSSVEIRVPVLVNVTPIKKGDELIADLSDPDVAGQRVGNEEPLLSVVAPAGAATTIPKTHGAKRSAAKQTGPEKRQRTEA